MKSEELKKQAEPVAESEKPELGTDGYKIDASNIGSTTSNKPIFEVAEKPEGESRKNISKETFERLLKNEVHKSLCVMDVGSERHPDYIIAGFDNLVKDMSEILYPAPPEAEPVESAEEVQREAIYKQASHYAQVQWGDPAKNYNRITEYDNAREDFIAGALWVAQALKK